jgi:hypothetical protein
MLQTVLRGVGRERTRSAPCAGRDHLPREGAPVARARAVAGSPPALGDSLPGSLTRVVGVVRAGVRTGRRPATRESQVPGNNGYGIHPRPQPVARVAVSAASRLMALTSWLASRAATSRLVAASLAQVAARTWFRPLRPVRWAGGCGTRAVRPGGSAPSSSSDSLAAGWSIRAVGRRPVRLLPGIVQAGHEVPGAGCTANAVANCSERHRSADGDRTKMTRFEPRPRNLCNGARDPAWTDASIPCTHDIFDV